MSTAPATKPEAPAVIFSVLDDARNKKLTAIPAPPASIARAERIKHTERRKLEFRIVVYPFDTVMGSG
jgi:hypothetical protein